MLVCVFLCAFARETAGAARIRLSLRPCSSLEQGERDAKLGRNKPRERGLTSCSYLKMESEVSHRHCERSEAIHLSTRRKNGLLRFARNDGVLGLSPNRS